MIGARGAGLAVGGRGEARGGRNGSFWLVGALVGVFGWAGCGAATTPPLPAAPPPSAAAPALAIPADLDVVVRVDLDPIRAALPEDAAFRLTEALGVEDDSTAHVVRQALGRARQVWIASLTAMRVLAVSSAERVMNISKPRMSARWYGLVGSHSSARR